MNQAIEAYRHVSATPEFQERERLFSKARHDEAQSIHDSRMEGEMEGRMEERMVWQGVVADMEAQIRRLRSRLGETE